MNSIKCPECGLVNFAEAEECKRCHLKFHQCEPPLKLYQTQISLTLRLMCGLDNPEPLVPNPQEAASPAPLPEYFDAEPDTLNAPWFLFAVYLFCARWSSYIK